MRNFSFRGEWKFLHEVFDTLFLTTSVFITARETAAGTVQFDGKKKKKLRINESQSFLEFLTVTTENYTSADATFSSPTFLKTRRGITVKNILSFSP